MADDLTALENWLGPLIQSLASSEKNKLFKRLGQSIRKRQADRIRKQQNPDGTPFTPRKSRIQKNNQVKARKAMFLKLRQARHLKIKTDAEGVAVGYQGKAAKIAKIHQGGFLARVAPAGPLFQYPARKLLGFSTADKDGLLSEIEKHLTM